MIAFDDSHNYYTTAEASEIIGRSQTTIQRWIGKGKIQTAKWAVGMWLIEKSEVEALAEITPTQAEQLAINGRNAVRKINGNPPTTLAGIKRRAAARNREIMLARGTWKPAQQRTLDDMPRNEELEYLEELL